MSLTRGHHARFGLNYLLLSLDGESKKLLGNVVTAEGKGSESDENSETDVRGKNWAVGNVHPLTKMPSLVRRKQGDGDLMR